MDVLAATTLAVIAKLAPMAVLFAMLALVVKRGAVWDALKRSRHESEVNLGLVIINYVILAAFFASAAAWWADALVVSETLAAFWAGATPVLTLVVTLLLGEFVIYWRHRIEHLPALWPMHAVHHSDEAMTWLALLRKHPLAYILALFVDTAPLLLLGLPVWAIAACALVRAWWGHFIHADVPWTLGPVGKWLISPAAHRLHHIDDLQLCGSNYGGVLTLWDRLFGTYIDPAPYVNCRTGVDGGSRGLVGEIARPFEAWAGTRRADTTTKAA
ncbi:sterol desaturase family protein [Parerythrobacter jejuensis]|uniref:Sterol desaturase family protein n=1 Tax=Parerythrobacter jejuensis TaxID=795812 RepID=A0A845AP96_9SPHN|nr:sterol desaturase family protein [Parerythrobacter jejuensis]MXP32652.1 sterol desaturase family protein [Parerythrobacter jejuensis]